MATKLPSGKWRAQVLTGKDAAGKRIYESFIADTEDEADFAALEFKLKKKKAARGDDITLGEAIDRYITSKDAILSPSTVREYKRMRKTNLPELMAVKLPKLRQETIQTAINNYTRKHSPKSTRNIYGLISATLNEYMPDMILRITLPQKEKHDIYMPAYDDMKKLFGSVAGTDMELPVLLAACVGLRRSEICALEWRHIDMKKNIIKIRQAKVLNYEDEYVLKTTKSLSGARTFEIPPEITALLTVRQKDSERVISLTPNIISERFAVIIKKLGLPHIRFHDLRHYNASIMLALGIPDKYAMERMGHATNNMLKTVYQHTFSSEKTEVDKRVNEYFSKLLQHDMQHEG